MHIDTALFCIRVLLLPADWPQQASPTSTLQQQQQLADQHQQAFPTSTL
jgi:hypothetical protein